MRRELMLEPVARSVPVAALTTVAMPAVMPSRRAAAGLQTIAERTVETQAVAAQTVETRTVAASTVAFLRSAAAPVPTATPGSTVMAAEPATAGRRCPARLFQNEAAECRLSATAPGRNRTPMRNWPQHCLSHCPNRHRATTGRDQTSPLARSARRQTGLRHQARASIRHRTQHDHLPELLLQPKSRLPTSPPVPTPVLYRVSSEPLRSRHPPRTAFRQVAPPCCRPVAHFRNSSCSQPSPRLRHTEPVFR
ncbi:hypothetical protein BTIS_1391 [Bifidobacterium tissieri]|uniref:Uncharacterized protein n=1 Tax=Bifidobacterium tissieri TaxID=1630162 RepID=A0A261FDT7_9BIFI|nr:hypothetical protein BTIS_1391 [Bifidobacterium tissieri]